MKGRVCKACGLTLSFPLEKQTDQVTALRLRTMEQTNEKHHADISSALSSGLKHETISNELEVQQRVDSLQTRTGMSPSNHNNFFPWIPVPLNQPVVPEAVAPLFNERRLDPLEWIELLEQTECLDYVSPDVEACIEMQSRMEGNQELDLTGTEFISSPAIPKLPSLNNFPVEHTTILKPIAQPQRNVQRRPGLREKFPRQQPLTEYSRRNYIFTAERMVENKRPTRRKSLVARRNSERPPPRSASRSLQFEAPQYTKPTARRKRVSWSGHSPSAKTDAPTQRQCKSARKSKDCMIPGCTKGARSRGLCKRHGGGKRCTYSGCARSDQGGGFCIAHGGGKRCASEGCQNSAQSRGLCKSHGGGKRCRAEGCAKSSQGGGFCRGHGAGRASKFKAEIVFL